jgi:hypothetical protein
MLRVPMQLTARAFVVGLAVSCALEICNGMRAVAAPVVWAGPTITFSKEGSADHTQPENQDQLTEDVIFTRAETMGLFNIAVENGYGVASPAGTLWATPYNNMEVEVAAANYAALTWDTWTTAYGGMSALMTNIVNSPAVVRIVNDVDTVEDDIYLDLMFSEWGTFGSGGQFTYQRSTPIVPTGDYNDDQFVNAADYTVWRNSLGAMVPHGTGADGNLNGEIDRGDYTFWKQHYGDVIMSAGALLDSASVPEPATIGLIAVALVCICFRRRAMCPT